CEQPYRGALPIVRAPVFERASSAVMARLALGASAAIYLSIWTLGWSGGAWPAHVALLDASFAIACLIVGWQARRWLAAAPLAPVYVHFAMELGWLRTAGDFGLCAVASGFALLVIALSTSWRARRRDEIARPDTQAS
ncbi:MAG: hypothetical protein K8H88_10445, partial [Sandaracinaceae bacterium]|nr:hypothetical protein [Sandaracinaceae bacterium]